MDTTRPNLLDVPPVGAPFADQVRHRLAQLVTTGYPVHPLAQQSTHPLWKDHSRTIHLFHSPTPVLAVYTVTDAEWVEFQDTFAGGDHDHYGIVGDILTEDGWTGQYCYERPLGDLIQALTQE